MYVFLHNTNCSIQNLTVYKGKYRINYYTRNKQRIG